MKEDFSRVQHEGPRQDSDPYKDRVGAARETEEKPRWDPQIANLTIDRRGVLSKAIGSAAYLGLPTLGAASLVRLREIQLEKQSSGTIPETHSTDLTTDSSTLSTEDALMERGRLVQRTFTMGGLAGRHIHNLAADYLGFHARTPLPEAYTTHPDLIMERVWDRKEIANADLKITGLGNKLIESYREDLIHRKEQPMNLIEFMKGCENVIRKVEREQDIEKVGILYQLDKDALSRLRELGSRIHSRMLIGFSMTEIMASGIDTETDILSYDAVLRNNGAKFVTRTPAAFDSQQSFGPYQVTPFAMHIGLALTKERKPYKEYRGASKMNRALPDSSSIKIPEEFQNELNFHKFVEPDHHHSFAYQFALHNLASALGALQMLDPKLRTELSKISDETLTSYIATSHHKPTPSSAALMQHLQTGQRHDYRAFCAPNLQRYATKTLVNESALTNLRVA